MCGRTSLRTCKACFRLEGGLLLQVSHNLVSLELNPCSFWDFDQIFIHFLKMFFWLWRSLLWTKHCECELENESERCKIAIDQGNNSRSPWTQCQWQILCGCANSMPKWPSNNPFSSSGVWIIFCQHFHPKFPQNWKNWRKLHTPSDLFALQLMVWAIWIVHCERVWLMDGPGSERIKNKSKSPLWVGGILIFHKNVKFCCVQAVAKKVRETLSCFCLICWREGPAAQVDYSNSVQNFHLSKLSRTLPDKWQSIA